MPILKFISLLSIMVLLFMLVRMFDDKAYIYMCIYICKSNITAINIDWNTLFNSTLHLILNDVAFTLIVYVKIDRSRVIEYALKTKTS